jgi:hypothetical protein
VRQISISSCLQEIISPDVFINTRSFVPVLNAPLIPIKLARAFGNTFAEVTRGHFAGNLQKLPVPLCFSCQDVSLGYFARNVVVKVNP